MDSATKQAAAKATGVIALALFALSIQFLLRARPFIGSVDFFHYVLYARDLAAGAKDVPLNRYTYFPGVYSFWKLVFYATDGSLGALQWAYAAALAANAALIAAIVACLAVWPLAVLCIPLYLFNAAQVEGICGVTEPLATIPFLLGLLWYLAGGRYGKTARLLGLGAGLGAALYMKQQAGLLALGALALPLDRKRRWRPRDSLMVAAASGFCFLALFGLGGGGLGGLKSGLAIVHSYQPTGSWYFNLSAVLERTKPLSNFAIFGVVAWVACAWFGNAAEDFSAALGISTLAMLAGVLQFSRRGYYHYALLILPPAVLSAALGSFYAVKTLFENSKHMGRFSKSAPLIGTFALLYFNLDGADAFIDKTKEQLKAPTRWVEMKTVASNFGVVCGRVPPGSDLLLVPTRQDAVHWLCKTRAVSLSNGYSWLDDRDDAYLEALKSPTLRNVFVFSDDSGDFESAFFLKNPRTRLMKELKALGYKSVVRGQAGELFERGSGPAPK